MPYLPAAVASILDQSFGDLLLIIVDDGSTDGTPSFLETLTDARVRVMRQQAAGLTAALNRCIAVVDTALIARMDADDVARPQRLVEQVALMTAHSEVVAAGTGIEYFADGGRRTLPRALPVAHGDIVRTLLRGGHGFCHPTMVYRTEVARRVGGYRVAGPGQLAQFALALSCEGQLANVRSVLLAKRLHPDSVSWRHAREVAAAERRAALSWRTHGDVAAHMPSTSLTRSQAIAVVLRAYSQTEYRKALVAYLRGEGLAAAWHAALAAMGDPVRAIRRLSQLRAGWRRL